MKGPDNIGDCWNPFSLVATETHKPVPPPPVPFHASSSCASMSPSPPPFLHVLSSPVFLSPPSAPVRGANETNCSCVCLEQLCDVCQECQKYLRQTQNTYNARSRNNKAGLPIPPLPSGVMPNRCKDCFVYKTRRKTNNLNVANSRKNNGRRKAGKAKKAEKAGKSSRRAATGLLASPSKNPKITTEEETLNAFLAAYGV
jgi:hypothetical protein